MKVTVKIEGWHPRWNQISSIKAIRAASECGLADAKRVVDQALAEESAEFEVDGLVEAKRVAQELADLGAIISCGGVTYDSFHGEERGLPYRKEAIGTVMADGASEDDVFSARLITGTAMDHFELSVPMSGSWDVRVGARLIAQTEDRITFTIDCADTQEREFWREMLADSETEADLHKPG